MTQYNRTAESVKAMPTADDRRVYVDAVAATGAPSTPKHGYSTNGRARGIATIKPKVGGTCDVKVWRFDQASQTWCVDATVGTVTVTFAAGPRHIIVDLSGFQLWFVEVLNVVVPIAVDAWQSVVDIAE